MECIIRQTSAASKKQCIHDMHITRDNHATNLSKRNSPISSSPPSTHHYQSLFISQIDVPPPSSIIIIIIIIITTTTIINGSSWREANVNIWILISISRSALQKWCSRMSLDSAARGVLCSAVEDAACGRAVEERRMCNETASDRGSDSKVHCTADRTARST